MALVTDEKGRKWTGQSCILPLPQAHRDPMWTLTCPHTRHQCQGAIQNQAKVVLFFSCVGVGQHDPSVHQVSGTLEGRMKQGGAGKWGYRSNPALGDPRIPTSIEFPPHPGGL